jgi:hypothetical protein
MNIKIKINDIVADVFFEDKNSIMYTKVISNINTIIYSSRINRNNDIIAEEVNLAYIELEQIELFKKQLEIKIIESL